MNINKIKEYEKKLPKAEYMKVMKCPECGFYSLSDDGMPDRDDFTYDRENRNIIICPCGCRFRE